MKLCGIYGKEELKCGCIAKYYKGGKRIIDPLKCLERHPSSIAFICIVCKMEMTKRDLQIHKWKHSY